MQHVHSINYQGDEGKFIVVRNHCFLNTICPMKCVCYIFETGQKGRNFQIKLLNIQYSLDNVSNIYWTRCLYLLIKIQFSNQSKLRQNIFILFIICPIICSSKSYFDLPHEVCPTPLLPGIPAFWTWFDIILPLGCMGYIRLSSIKKKKSSSFVKKLRSSWI